MTDAELIERLRNLADECSESHGEAAVVLLALIGAYHASGPWPYKLAELAAGHALEFVSFASGGDEVPS